MPDPAIAIGGGSALLGASSARRAAKAQQASAQDEIELARETRDLTREDLAPFVGAGGNALAAYNYELGLGERPVFGGDPLEINQVVGTRMVDARRPTGGGERAENWHPHQIEQEYTRYQVGDQFFDDYGAAQDYASENATAGTPYAGFKETPGYQFRLDEGRGALEASAATRGGITSGSALKALTRYGQDYASGEHNNYLNRLAGLAASGQNAAAGLASANQNYAAQAGNALSGIGNAQAAGAIGVGNALMGGINNGLGIWQYQNQLARPNAPQAG